MDDAIVEFYYGSVVNFSQNTGIKGGAMLLLQGSWIKLYSNVKITFYKNKAIVGISRNTKCENLIGFPKSGHNLLYSTVGPRLFEHLCAISMLKVFR